MIALPLERGVVYGPINSRRLGISLGVNLLPIATKACSFNCVYCYYGSTPQQTLRPDSERMPWPSQVLRAVENALRARLPLDAVTFSGNGEPTLHPAFPEIAAGVRRLRDRWRPGVRLALFSNASTACRADVIESIRHFDVPMLKLGAGDETTFQEIDRPAAGIHLAEIIAWLRAAPAIHTQTVLIQGRVTNATGDTFEAYVRALSVIRPACAHIYSTDYPVVETGGERIPPYELARVAETIALRTGLRVEGRWLRN